ncbi:MAG: TatD family hydrolase, partial [Verrucomicrobiota bacterium]|nr:TatD family hydrolase [Verrucomicrobiota bacterium]
MKLFDCHNHIQDGRLFPMLGKVMQRARTAGVVAMGVKGCCEADWPNVVRILETCDGIYPAFGLHPWFIADRSPDCYQALEKLLREYPRSSVGEIGIDHAIDDRDDADQESVFLAQLEIARRLERPVTIHCRRAWGRLIELLDGFGKLPRGMLIHCFGGSAEVARELVKRGAYISFSGSITRPNAKRAELALRAVTADRLLIETDAPDLLPTTAEGPLNEPANLRYVLAKAAGLRGMPEAELAELTFNNAERFFSPVHGQDAHATCGTGFQPVVPESPAVELPASYAQGNRTKEFHIRQGAHLPHWTRGGGIYSVTFRLADSLPCRVLVSWKTERDNIIRIATKQQRPLSDVEKDQLHKLHSEKVEAFLDAGQGECWLGNEGVAELVQCTLMHFDGERYRLVAWCV